MARDTLASLTDKQRAVLDLLIQHKSSKEIARALSISPYTVDQRIGAVRQKLRASNRSEVARAYSALLMICDESAYGFPYVETKPLTMNVPFRPRAWNRPTLSLMQWH
ncbi:MAG: helix-turn-helix transcriptional regulator [Pseudomonadota bacterium]|nr:helix-turn-helix transcriptional regulator [Pseudomonadota bacterium]